MMKFVYPLFAFYMAVLSVYPCYEDNCANKFITRDVEQASHDEEEEESPCTPFCVSACCAVPIFFSTQVHILPAIQETIPKNSTYTMVFSPPVVISIWQPPKLA